MVTEYDIPPPEGPTPMSPSQVRMFDDNELPYDVGSLEREALKYLGDWNFVVSRRGIGLGIVYRMGVKTVVDDEGDPLELLINFNSPFVKHGNPLTEEAKKEYHDSIRRMNRELVMKLSLTTPNVAVMSITPPEYMQRELEELLKTHTVKWPEES